MAGGIVKPSATAPCATLLQPLVLLCYSPSCYSATAPCATLLQLLLLLYYSLLCYSATAPCALQHSGTACTCDQVHPPESLAGEPVIDETAMAGSDVGCLGRDKDCLREPMMADSRGVVGLLAHTNR